MSDTANIVRELIAEFAPLVQEFREGLETEYKTQRQEFVDALGAASELRAMAKDAGIEHELDDVWTVHTRNRQSKKPMSVAERAAAIRAKRNSIGS